MHMRERLRKHGIGGFLRIIESAGNHAVEIVAILDIHSVDSESVGIRDDPRDRGYCS